MTNPNKFLPCIPAVWNEGLRSKLVLLPKLAAAHRPLSHFLCSPQIHPRAQPHWIDLLHSFWDGELFDKYEYTRSLDGPSGLLDFVLRALRALRPCDPRRCVHDACIHDACIHDACIHDACIHDVMHVSMMHVSLMHVSMMHVSLILIHACMMHISILIHVTMMHIYV